MPYGVAAPVLFMGGGGCCLNPPQRKRTWESLNLCSVNWELILCLLLVAQLLFCRALLFWGGEEKTDVNTTDLYVMRLF